MQQPTIITTSCTSNISGATSKKQKTRSNSESDKVSISLSSGERLDTASSSKNSSNHSLRGHGHEPLSFEETASAIAPASAALITSECGVAAAAATGSSTIVTPIVATTAAASIAFYGHHPSTSNRIDSTIQMHEEIIDPIAEEEDDDIDIDNIDDDELCQLASSVVVKCDAGARKLPTSSYGTPSTSTGLTALKLNAKGKTKTACDNTQAKMNTSRSLNDNSIVNTNKTKAKLTARTATAPGKGRANLLLGRKCLTKIVNSKQATPADEGGSEPDGQVESTTNSSNKKDNGKLGYNNLIASLLRTTTL